MTRILPPAAFFAALIPSTAHAQFQVDWYTIDGGGGTCAGLAFSLTRTIGHHQHPDYFKPHGHGCGLI